MKSIDEPSLRMPGRGITVVLVALVLLPFLVIVLATSLNNAKRLSETDEVWVPVRPASSGEVVPVDLALTWDRTPPVVAPAWSGVVTAALSHQNSTLHSGDVVVEIDRIKRLGLHTDAPFYRILTLWDHGPDVSELNSVLRTLGMSDADGDEFTYETLRGVRNLAVSLGLVGAVDAFDPGWIVYLPAEQMNVPLSWLSVGAPAPSPGSVLVEPGAVLSDAVIVGADTLFREPVAPTPDVVDLDTLPRPVIEEEDKVLFDEGDQLVLSGATVEGTLGSAQISEASRNSLTELIVTGQDHLSGVLVKHRSANSWSVPASSVYSSSAGTMCVRFRTAISISNVRVVVIGDSAGVSTVQGPLSADGAVLVAPPGTARTCD